MRVWGFGLIVQSGAVYHHGEPTLSEIHDDVIILSKN